MCFIDQEVAEPFGDRDEFALCLLRVEETRRGGDVEAVAPLQADHDLARALAPAER